MKKILFVIVGLVALGIGYWLLSPLWRVEYVSEALPEALPVVEPRGEESIPATDAPVMQKPVVDEVRVLKTGTFTGFDKIHTGSGTARLIEVGGKTYIRFEQDFSVNNGPDLYVGLGKGGEYIKGSELGELKGTVGSQNYELPAGVSATGVTEVWVWCKAFSVPFAKAELR